MKCGEKNASARYNALWLHRVYSIISSYFSNYYNSRARLKTQAFRETEPWTEPGSANRNCST